MTICIHNARLLTIDGDAAPRRGTALGELGIIERGHLLIDGSLITHVGSGPPANLPPAVRLMDAGGRVVMPAFVDAHTHACWAGERYDEWDMKRAGATYLDILKAGGGIMSTVRSVREASEDELVELLELRTGRMHRLGTTTIEIKSGYGLSTDAELKMLRAITRLASSSPLHVTPTFLGAHAKDPDRPHFVEETINETLPAVAEAFPGLTCDAYCEEGAWSLEETTRLFERAIELGCPLRVHADQFNALGMTTRAVEMGARSVDHLEASTREELDVLARSATFGVALPSSGFQVDDRYAPARDFVDAGGALVVASNYNPGSAPSPNLAFSVALACRKLGLSPAESIVATTWNAACLLGVQDRIGALKSGYEARVQILDCTDERELAYEYATAGPACVIIGEDDFRSA